MDAKFIIAVDVGGTCTDCIVFSSGRRLYFGKALSTPPDFAAGVIDAVRTAVDAMGLSLAQLMSRTRLFLHGSTVVDNTIFTREGAATGLITTAGFEDTLHMTRGAYGRWSGLPEERIKHPTMTDRAPPLIPRSRIVGVHERVDRDGEIVTPLDETDVIRAVEALCTEGVDAIAICLLWSFRNPRHECRIRDIVRDMVPGVHVSLSSEIAPVPGEYERSSTTVINAYAGKVTQAYLDDLAERLKRLDYAGALLVMQGYGGLVSGRQAATKPVGMIECGPAAGVVGAQHLGSVLGKTNIIAADMGGTTFKVGVIQDGEFDYAREPIVDRFHYVAPKLEIVSIGAGGGSIISVDPRTGRPRIGPQSAGSRPGPVCYGRGGTEPTLTDIAAIIGYLDPGNFLAGAMRLDIDAARAAFAVKVAGPMGMSVEEAAIGIYRIASAQIADLVRNVTIERGLDPRDFVLHAFGGSCGLFAAAFARDLAISRVVVPHTASVNCAYGMIAADVIHDHAAVEPMALPAAPEAVNAVLAPLAETARAELVAEGFAPEDMRFDWSVDLRYGRQVHHVTTPLEGGPPVDATALDRLARSFEALYEQRYGRGSAFRAAGIELVTFRLRAAGRMERPAAIEETAGDTDPSHAALGRRTIYVEGAGGMVDADIYDFERMVPANEVEGPAVIQTPITTVVLQSGQRARMDPHRNLMIEAV